MRTGGKSLPVRIFYRPGSVIFSMGLALAGPMALMPVPAAAQAAQLKPNDQSLGDFYRARGGAPLWLARQSGSAAQLLLQRLDSAHVDGLDPRKYHAPELDRALQAAWGGKPKAVDRADRMLSQAFADYVNDLRRVPNSETYFVDRELAPHPRNARVWLDQAAAAPSLEKFITDMGWMNPLYAQLRQALADRSYGDDHQRRLLWLNLQRARTLPGGQGRYIVVNAAAQRLYAYENGRVADSMNVVVGKPIYPTPMMAALIRFANLNPYWYVPPDLAAERIAPNVVKMGLGYLKSRGYEVVSDFSDNPQILDPATVDWKAVADHKAEVWVRQLPGPHNSMGRMKFMFPNREGVYLHDTPEKELLSEASRLFSGGCVRLEDASRLGEWLFGRHLEWQGAGTEERVDLDRPVPVYITYLTAVPDNGTVAFYDDIYKRDAARLAGEPVGAGSAAAAP
ncbi:L,D-transpeptidase family protein [Sphingomonas piscis]|uniref:L,D-transpeptidase family protein n=1 Tax=Sphingomonas piscis TaxID=2714943 RepID=UPI001FEC6AE5|nr:L,D-transpeptidase family protein [Sphingomonas piscis]